MKIITQKKLGFRNPKTGEILKVEPFAFFDLPEWAEKDPMFLLGRQAQLIEIVNVEVIQPSSEIPPAIDNDNKIEEIVETPKKETKKTKEKAE